MFINIVGIGGCIHHKYSSGVTIEQKVQKLEEDYGNHILEDEIFKIRHVFDAAKEKFLKVPDALKDMPKMDPKG